MIRFKITNMKTKAANTVSDVESVYDHVEKITGDELTAIEVSSWAYLASVSDCYERVTFTVEVIED
jgi:hypothetical protein